MGRAFEFRKARKFKRWGNMARVFTKLGKEITIAAKAGGPDPENNPHLRALMQNAKKCSVILQKNINFRFWPWRLCRTIFICL